MEKSLDDMSLDKKVIDFYHYLKNKHYNLPLERIYANKKYLEAVQMSCEDSRFRSDRRKYLEILSYYKSVIARKEYLNKTVEKIYPFSNENQHLLYQSKKINVEGKKVFLVGSSGDQVLNAILNGASEITVGDSNIYTQLFTELKIALISTMEYENFKIYLNDDFYKNFFKNHNIYASASHLLSDKSKEFWDTVMLDFDSETLKNLFHKDFNKNGNKFYTDKNEYDKLKSILKGRNFKIKYIVQDYSLFPSVLKEKFHFVSFSNIKDYCNGNDKFYKTLKDIYENNLEEKGVIQVSTQIYEYEEKNLMEELEEILPHSRAFVLKKTGLLTSDKSTKFALNSICVRKEKEIKTEKNINSEDDYVRK